MSVSKYLQRYAEARARRPELSQLGEWTHAITIPARRESVDCLRGLAAAGAPTLVVLVVNAAGDPEDRRVNAELIAALEARAPAIWRCDGMSLHRLAALDVLLVDCSTPPHEFGPRDGVGLARKLGADLITRLIADGQVSSPWIHTTDADAELPALHFDRVAALAPGTISAAVAPFRHVGAGDPRVYEATLRYELSLRYYVLGLRSAGSPYAFHSIGSLISVAASSYAQVRGFPRRQAGEDFYLLDKLAKVGRVASLGGAPVRIRSRRSSRAPFGTGPAVEALLGGKPFEVYDPRVFEVLGQALRTIATPELDHPNLAPEVHPWLDAARSLTARYPASQHAARLREHFDGFRTLKLIHALTARWPKLPWSAALERARFLDVDPKLELEAQRDQLAMLEGDWP